jgi:DNA repair photolyase
MPATLTARKSNQVIEHDLLPPLEREPVDFWDVPATIQPNNFIHKSLSNWSFNIAIGCSHACRFCYVPSAATIKMGALLERHGIDDPDAQWGEYVLLRRWDEKKFLSSLRAAEETPKSQLNPDGNRAIMYCSTTDPYQTIRHPNPIRQRQLMAAARYLITRSLELIRDHSSLRVRILTRSPLAKQDFDLFKSFGSRLLFGMSLPTMRNDLARIYEPHAPAPSKRLETLAAAKASGLNVYVAIAPTYPECDVNDFRNTLEAIREVDPITIFHEPINIRADNVMRIASHARSLGIKLRSEVFATREAWQDYAIGALGAMKQAAKEIGLAKRLHSWPDKALGTANVLARQPNRDAYQIGLQRAWQRISEWPE